MTKWAVENTNLDNGWTVRYIECQTESTADILCEAANVAFTAMKANCISKVVKL